METPVTFECEGSVLMGILSIPDTPPRRGVVFVVADGPQYRAGVQRQLLVAAHANQPRLNQSLAVLGWSSFTPCTLNCATAL